MTKTQMLICLALFAIASAQAQEKSSWADKIKLSGDVRFREEYIDKEGEASRNRLRLRARLKADADILPTLKATVGMRTGGDDPVSGNQTLGSAFTTKSFGLELASIRWKPEATEILTLEGGKMAKPWLAVGDLVWDGDLNPEGAHLKIEPKFGIFEFCINGGAFQVAERHKTAGFASQSDTNTVQQTDKDTFLYTGQVGIKIKPADDVQLLLAGNYHYFDNLAGYATLYDDAKGFGNSTFKTASGKTFYKYEYRLVEGLADGRFKISGFPIKIYGDYVQNTDPDSNNKGYMAGLTLGEAKEPWTFSLDYNYRRLEKDAVVGALTDSDSFGGGTDGKGHRISGALQLAKNWQFGTTFFWNDAGISGTEKSYKRLQVDVSAKF